MAEFVGRARVSLAGIATRKPPPVRTRVRVRDGEIRLSRVLDGTEHPYLVVSVDRVQAKKGEGPGAVELRIDDETLRVALGDRRTRRRFIAALGR